MFKHLLPAIVARYLLRCTHEEEVPSGEAEGTAEAESVELDAAVEDEEPPKAMQPQPKQSPNAYSRMRCGAPSAKAAAAPSLSSKKQVPAQPKEAPVQTILQDFFPSVAKPPVPLVLGIAPGAGGNFESFDQITASLLDGCINQVFFPVLIDNRVVESYGETCYKAENGYTFCKLNDGWYLSAEPFENVKTAEKQDW